jgi:hypothetical protein
MTNVACFCGCLYSFGGDAGGCPKCGKTAIVRMKPVSGNARESSVWPDVLSLIADAALRDGLGVRGDSQFRSVPAARNNAVPG